MQSIVRIARTNGNRGGTRFTFHADVIADTPDDALRAARENRVLEWRLTESRPLAGDGKTTFAVVGTVQPHEALNPQEPVNASLLSVIEAVKKHPSVAAARMLDDGRLSVTVRWRTKHSRNVVQATAKRAGFDGIVVIRNASFVL